MNNEVDDLKKHWQGARASMGEGTVRAAELAELAKKRRREVVWFQYGNAIVLTGVVIVLILCFVFVMPLRETMSVVGEWLMAGGLTVRVVIELFSAARSQRIRVLDSSVKNLESTIAYYRFRKTVHGPVTYTIVVLYLVGFLMLTPELLNYTSVKWMIFFDVAFAVSGVVLVQEVRKGIRKEMGHLKEVVRLKEEMSPPTPDGFGG